MGEPGGRWRLGLILPRIFVCGALKSNAVSFLSRARFGTSIEPHEALEAACYNTCNSDPPR
jgi:hypothetical protein